MALVEVRELVRTYVVRDRRRGLLGSVRDLFGGPGRTLRALDGVSFDVEPGEIVGYIGPNGAGKSTTIKCITGILRPTSGTVRVAGLDPWAQRTKHVHNIGVVFGQRTQLWWDLGVVEAFDLLASVYRVDAADYRSRLDELVALLELEPLLNRPVRELSLGERMRCDLAASLLHAPPLVLLDEPTIGLDVAVKHRIRRFVQTLAAERGIAVLLTTHDLGDVEQLCDRVLLLDTGRVVFSGDVDGLRAHLGGRRRLEVDASGPVADDVIAALGAERLGPSSFALSFDAAEGAGPVVQRVLERVEADDLRLQEPSVEDVVAAVYGGDE